MEKNKQRIASALWLLLGLLGVVVATLLVAGRTYYRHEFHNIRREKDSDLQAIATLKVNQITAWRQERLTDARFNSAGTIRTHVLQWLVNSEDETARTKLVKRLKMFQEGEGYQNMILAAPDGTLQISMDPRLTNLETSTRDLVAQAIATRQPVFGELLRCPVCNEIHLDVAAPILDTSQRPVAALVLRSDPRVALYPLIQTWPTDSATAETLLVRRKGDNVLFLNTLRHSTAPALTLTAPLTEPQLPAALALAGQTGIVTGRDYRGVDVAADIRPIPDSTWIMIAKMDTSEMLAEARYHGGIGALILTLSICVVGTLLLLVFTYRQRHVYKQLYRAEQKRRESQEEIRATLYGIGDGVIATDDQGRVARMNPVAEQLTGWSEREALGRPMKEVFHIVNEMTRQKVEDPVASVLRDGKTVALANHTLLIARDGTERPIADSGAPIRVDDETIAGVVLVFRDQTKERAAQAELHQREAFTRSVLDAVGAHVAVLNREGVITAINAAWERSAGENSGPLCEASTGVGIDYLAVMRTAVEASVEGAAEAVRGIQDVLAGCAPKFTMEYPCHAPNEKRWFLLRVTPLSREAGGAVLTHVDITAQKQAEEAGTRMRAQLQQTQKLESLGTLAGGVAHEINNPIMGIMNYAQLIREGIDPDSPEAEYAKEIGAETERVATIVKNLLAFARKDNETYGSTSRVCDIVENTLSLCRSVMRHDQIALKVDVPDTLPPVRCRNQQIRQVIMNLLTNARDALNTMPSDSKTQKIIRIAAQVIQKHGAPQMRLTIEDHGPGIPDDVCDRIFEPFFTSKPRDKGTGLGLSISHGIVQEHGGELTVESEVGQWTRFHIDLPIDTSDFETEERAIHDS